MKSRKEIIQDWINQCHALEIKKTPRSQFTKIIMDAIFEEKDTLLTSWYILDVGYNIGDVYNMLFALSQCNLGKRLKQRLGRLIVQILSVIKCKLQIDEPRLSGFDDNRIPPITFFEKVQQLLSEKKISFSVVLLDVDFLSDRMTRYKNVYENAFLVKEGKVSRVKVAKNGETFDPVTWMRKINQITLSIRDLLPRHGVLVTDAYISDEAYILFKNRELKDVISIIEKAQEKVKRETQSTISAAILYIPKNAEQYYPPLEIDWIQDILSNLLQTAKEQGGSSSIIYKSVEDAKK